jgi:hypothetical protein
LQFIFQWPQFRVKQTVWTDLVNCLQ